MVLAAGWVGTNHLGKLYSQDLNQKPLPMAILGSGISSEFALLDAYAEALASFPLLQNLLSEADQNAATGKPGARSLQPDFSCLR